MWFLSSPQTSTPHTCICCKGLGATGAVHHGRWGSAGYCPKVRVGMTRLGAHLGMGFAVVCGGKQRAWVGSILLETCWICEIGAEQSISGLDHRLRCTEQGTCKPLPLSMVSWKGAGGAIDGYVPRRASSDQTCQGCSIKCWYWTFDRSVSWHNHGKGKMPSLYRQCYSLDAH